ncbi:MAG TPA: bifunctional shikimate kinase/3-dehydroquinate synthase [Solirubrobacteraceae bacterium]|nr:bifunctional shikimate kinase/3-dehydroquinate synthase [Solirubrobacteraceae bacterium]
MEAPALVFIGFMGAGKTSAARAAASFQGGRAVDSDHEIEERLGTTIAAYFEEHGEPAFRAVEEEVVCGLLDRPPAPVLSLGGGAAGSPRVRELLKRHTVVLLDVDVETAWRRAGNKRRPLARDRDRFVALFDERMPLYESVADAVLLDSSREEVRRAAGALRGLADAPAGTKLLWAAAASGSYPVHVGEGLAGSGFWPVAGRRFVITDEQVGALYRIPDAQAELTIPAGEEHKTLATVERLLRGLAAAGMDHDDHVAALGGGVVGDVGGFCAAVYQRGVPVVQVPTTLVAQVDSAYGGKTGVDLPEGKNYAGAYHQPVAVVVDPATMATLPQVELAAGWAEVIKTALIAGGPLWERVRGGAPLDRDLVLACARTKLGVVASDERDAGRRQILNLGHTVGHAIETATAYRRYRHGEAVGLGLLAALELSGQAELRAEVAALLDARGLPTTLDGAVDVDEVVTATARDKKRRAGRVGFVLVEAPGDVRPGRPVAEGELRRAVAELRAG